MKDVIKFNGHLYQKLEEGAYTIQGEVIEVVRSQGGGKDAEELAEKIVYNYKCEKCGNSVSAQIELISKILPEVKND